MELYKLNKYQTPITDELKNSLHREVWDELVDFIDNVKFIQNLIAPEEIRGYAKDRIKHNQLLDNDPRKQFNDSRIVVDITNPHILENMDFFRERALFFEKNKCYTHIRNNPSTKSEYARFWKEEQRRWRDGLVRESDGEWIPGYYYFYLNYVQIWVDEKLDESNSKEKKEAARIRKFPKPWLGDYLFFHYFNQAQKEGKHCKLLKTRGVGFSFKTAAISPCNMYIKWGLPNFHLASDKTYLEGEKGVYGKVVDNLDWIGKTTPLPKIRLKNGLSDMEIQLGTLNEYGIKEGLLSSVYGISLKDNPDKARGIRGPLIHYEEDGLFKNLEKAWNVNRKAMEQGNLIHGTMFCGGTGGTVGADFEGSEKLFRNPKAYNIYGIPNVYDKNSDGRVDCGFFWPAYLNREECYTEDNGEPNIIKALIEILVDRHLVKYNSSDPLAITQKKAEECITPAEAVMSITGTLFPVADLKDYLEKIKIQGPKFLELNAVGELIAGTDGKITYSPNKDKFPLRSYRTTGNDLTGALEVFEMPRKDSHGVMNNRYIAGIDPIDSDTGTSLGNIWIFDTFHQWFVAEYTGRPKFADDFYELCRRLLIFYDARANYENNLKGLFTYFTQKNSTYLLCDTPSFLYDKELVKKGGYGNTLKGTRATQEINAYARRLLRDWLLADAHQIFQEYDDNYNIIAKKLNMHTIKSIPFLEELTVWNGDLNCDRVSGAGMCMILNEEYKKYNQVFTEKSTEKDFAADDYWQQYAAVGGFSYGPRR